MQRLERPEGFLCILLHLSSSFDLARPGQSRRRRTTFSVQQHSYAETVTVKPGVPLHRRNRFRGKSMTQKSINSTKSSPRFFANNCYHSDLSLVLGLMWHRLRSYQNHWFKCQNTTFSNIIHLGLAAKCELETIDDENENTSSPIF